MTPATVILFSDDAHRPIYTMLLQEAGFRVVETVSTSKIPGIAERERAAAVIVDLHAEGAATDPGAPALRADLGPAVPLLVLSRSAALAIDAKSKIATLPKPCHPRDVLRALNSLLGRSDRTARLTKAMVEEMGARSSAAEREPSESPSGSSGWNGEEMRRLWEGLRSD